MNDLKKHLQEERLHRINKAWAYLTPVQHISLFLRAVWWSLPSAIEIIENIRYHFNSQFVYYLYKAHWVGFRLSRWERVG
jgi:hypothetical protein